MYQETFAETEKESYAHSTPIDTRHTSEDNTAYEAVTGTVYLNNSSFTENAGLTPTMIDLENEVIPTVCPLWREVGHQLHLSQLHPSLLDEDCRVHGVRICCTRMFEEWLKQYTA